MLRYFVTAMVAIVAFSFVPASAGTISVTTLDGSQGFGHDPDKPAPTITADGFYAKGFDNGPGSVDDYNSIRFTPTSIGMTGLTLGQITGLSYYAKTNVEGLKDWRVKVYTEPQAGQISGWYGARIEGPTTSSGLDWTHHNITAYDRFTWGGGADYQASNPLLLSQVALAATHKVMFFDIIAGANSGGHDYDTYLNNITISANGFETATIQAAPVPLPAAAWAGFALFGMIAAKRRFGSKA